jgi:hypothetical protein
MEAERGIFVYRCKDCPVRCQTGESFDEISFSPALLAQFSGLYGQIFCDKCFNVRRKVNFWATCSLDTVIEFVKAAQGEEFVLSEENCDDILSLAREWKCDDLISMISGWMAGRRQNREAMEGGEAQLLAELKRLRAINEKLENDLLDVERQVCSFYAEVELLEGVVSASRAGLIQMRDVHDRKAKDFADD